MNTQKYKFAWEQLNEKTDGGLVPLTGDTIAISGPSMSGRTWLLFSLVAQLVLRNKLQVSEEDAAKGLIPVVVITSAELSTVSMTELFHATMLQFCEPKTEQESAMNIPEYIYSKLRKVGNKVVFHGREVRVPDVERLHQQYQSSGLSVQMLAVDQFDGFFGADPLDKGVEIFINVKKLCEQKGIKLLTTFTLSRNWEVDQRTRHQLDAIPVDEKLKQDMTRNRWKIGTDVEKLCSLNLFSRLYRENGIRCIRVAVGHDEFMTVQVS